MALSVVLTYHSLSQYSKEIIDYLNLKQFKIFPLTEASPDELSLRAHLIKTCDLVLVLPSRHFQKNDSCMETIHFAKEMKKEIYGILTNSNYKPFGALGAILCGSGHVFYKIYKLDTLKSELDTLAFDVINNIKPDANNTNSSTNPAHIVNSSINLTFLDSNADILISRCGDNTKNISELIEQALESKQLSYKIEDSSLGKSYVKGVKALVIIMSAEYEENFNCKLIVQKAKELNLKMIPISIARAWKPTDWLGLIMAGKIFYRIFDKEQAYKVKYDSTPMNDLIMALIVATSPLLSENEKEKPLIISLNKQIDECKTKLSKWPPNRRVREIPEEKPVKIDFKAPTSSIEFNDVHYEVTRISFSVPASIFDNNGAPIRTIFDCMISYQWDKQDLVRYLYCDLHMRKFKIWYDIWGGMQGNSNDAMATAIECSKVILVFLSSKYQQSANCKLEFNYAVSRGKPFIFIVVEQNLKIEKWIEPHYNESLKFNIFQAGDEREVINGVSKKDIICKAIRDTEDAQPENDYFQLSEEIISLKELLMDALDDLYETTETQRKKECTRCKKEYDSLNPSGCKMHGDYYLGGTLIAGRWVCCSQLDKNSTGCQNTTHTDRKIVWTLDPNYGTYKWVTQ